MAVFSVLSTTSSARSQGSKTAPIAPAAPASTARPISPSDRTVEFQFGNLLLTLERRLIRNQPSPRRLSREQWETTTRYEMRYRQMFEFNLKEVLPREQACSDFITS